MGVKLEIAGMHYQPHRGGDRQPHGVGNGMAHVEKLHAERSQWQNIARLDGMQFNLIQQVMLPQLHLGQAERQPCAVHGSIHVREDVGQRTDVVFVAVGEDDGPQLLPPLHHIGDIGNDDVNPQHVVLGEHETGVDEQHLFAVLDSHHVLADLAYTTQRNDPQTVSFVHVVSGL